MYQPKIFSIYKLFLWVSTTQIFAPIGISIDQIYASKKSILVENLLWPFTVRITCSGDLKILKLLGLKPQISKGFSRSLAIFFLTVGVNNFRKQNTSLFSFLALEGSKRWTGSQIASMMPHQKCNNCAKVTIQGRYILTIPATNMQVQNSTIYCT